MSEWEYDVIKEDEKVDLSFKSGFSREKSLLDLQTEILTVGEVTRYLKKLIESDRRLSSILIRGEVSNLRKHSSGHTYFSLKDKESQIRCALFRRVSCNLNFELEHGMKIIIKGNIEIYEPRGEYNAVVEEVYPEGVGMLHLAFIQLKNKLEKEGLFLSKYKKSLPKFPKVVGVITSSSGAAFHDILNVIKIRYPIVKIILIPTLVQGKEAHHSIVEAVKLMNELSEADVIILGRGGGSLEDLWCFNEEIVARAIFNSKIPIITGIGHETDYTIADFVADFRASTPSAAAEKAVPDIKEIYDEIRHLCVRSTRSINYLVDLHKSVLKQIISRQVLKTPQKRIQLYYRELDQTDYELKNIINKIIEFKKKKIELIESKINALNPKAILERGYSIIMKDGKTIKNCSDVKINEELNVILHKGRLDAKVKKIHKEL